MASIGSARTSRIAGIDFGGGTRDVTPRRWPARRKTEPAGGDLFVIVRTTQDPRFERRDRDLYRTEMADVVDAVLGTTIDVPTLDGPAPVKVPAGTQPGSLLRQRAKGLPPFGGGPRGDLCVQMLVRVPGRVTARQRRLFEELRALGQGGHGK